MAFVCGVHRAYVFNLGGRHEIAELSSVSMVRWRRVRDDISTAEVVVPTSECCDVLTDLRTIENELHIYRNDEVVWQGPITRLEYEDDVTRIFAEDILWQATRCVIQEGYDQSHPNIGNVISRMDWLLAHCYLRYPGNPWNITIRPIYGPDDPRTSRIVFAWQMYVWDDLDKYAEDYGADYTVYNREVYFWDVSLKWLIIPDLDESHLSQLPRIVEYGNQLGTRGIVTNGRGFAGVSAVAASSFAYYGTVFDWLTTNEIDGQPGTATDDEGAIVSNPDASTTPTPEELASWADTATRSIVERYPAPVSIVIPANTTLLPGAPWGIRDMVPGAWFQVSTTRLCRSVTEWQRLQEVVVTEEAPNGETIQFSAVSAPVKFVDPPGVYPVPPGGGGGVTPVPPAACIAVLIEPFINFTTNGWVLTGATSIATGRTGTGAQVIGSTSNIAYTIPGAAERATLVVGFAFRWTDANIGTRIIAQLRSDVGATVHNTLTVNTATGSMSLARGSTVYTSAPGVLERNVWAYIEVRINLGDAPDGWAIVRADGASVISLSNIDTKNAGSKTTYDQIRLGALSVGAINEYDDLYLSTGATCTFQGDPRPPTPCVEVLVEPFTNLTAWVNNGGTLVPGRAGTALRVSGVTANAQFTIPVDDRADVMTVGCAFQVSTLASVQSLVRFRSGGLQHGVLYVNTDGSIRATNSSGTDAGGSVGGLIAVNTWYYAEVRYTLGDSPDGVVVIRLNGVEWANVSNIDTRSGSATVYDVYDQIQLGTGNGSTGGTLTFDDVYIRTGSACAFKGDSLVSGASGVEQSITVAGSPAINNATQRTLGVRVQVARAGNITKIRYKRLSTSGSAITFNVWSDTGANLGQVTDTQTTTGTFTVTLPTPVAVTANQVVVVSMTRTTLSSLPSTAGTPSVTNSAGCWYLGGRASTAANVFPSADAGATIVYVEPIYVPT